MVKCYIGGSMRHDSVDINKVSPLMQKYLEVKNENPDIIIMVDKGERMFYYHYEHSFPVRFITWKGHLWKTIT